MIDNCMRSQQPSAGARIVTGGEDKWIHLSSINGDELSSFQSDGINEVLALNDGRLLLTPYGENRVSDCLSRWSQM